MSIYKVMVVVCSFAVPCRSSEFLFAGPSYLAGDAAKRVI